MLATFWFAAGILSVAFGLRSIKRFADHQKPFRNDA